MKKKTIMTLIIILGILIVVTIVVAVTLSGKTGWNEAGAFGELNLMEMDSEVTSNENETIFSVEDYMDFKFEGQLVIMEGTVNLKYCIGDEIIFEETYGPGTYEPKTDIYSGYDDELKIIINSSDDVQGNYNISIFYRYRRFHNYLNETMGVSQ